MKLRTSEPTKTETAKEETSSDKEVTQEPVSEEEAAADGFTDGSDGESAKLDTSEELTGIHHAGIDIKDYGSIEIELDADTAPITVTNFVKLAQDGFYDGLTFWRIIDGFMMQGGDPKGNGTGGADETIKGEFSQNGVENNLSHTRGVVSMARSNDPDSASSQFFICYSDDDTFLDGQYAAFGKVTEGMDVVDSFLKVERSLGSDGAQSSPNQDIVMEKVKMIDDDSDGNPRVEITMNDFLNE